MKNLLPRIQFELEGLYQFKLDQRVEDFCVYAPTQGERFLIREAPASLDLALCLNKKSLQNLERKDPFAILKQEDLNDFCTTIEGVSHFLYFLKKFHDYSPVTQLELELQAEIDKYLFVALLYYRQNQTIPHSLLHLLFENIRLLPGLTQEQQERYRTANQLASKFCAFLEKYLLAMDWLPLLTHAREFYRKNHWGKLRQLIP